ncbi:MauE/DoxX family redox-associated membrane protein [Xanthomarina sp.]|uniref:MauE/DoxX family redox-associated membrane protein n=1 Tax=Xanthomarina sp. TaxID=1931211 RepID=UPI002B7C7ED6|nr:MauE/DoxX family redox-associated membrane protein [Xanthomarina sp.]HLV38544.1 MauE/DoxX family redox-associated membrane protein [Xanthomarina sp.]
MPFKKHISKKGIVEIISMLFILLFVYASISKLLEFKDFQTQLGQSPLLGAFAIPISYGVICIELVTSILLAFKKTRIQGLYIAFMLMVMFTTYIIIILNFTSFTPCSCGGVLETLGWTEHLIFNTVFIVLALWALYLIEQVTTKQIALKSISLAIIGFAFVLGLFVSSEKEIKRNNAFQRKYMPHPIEKIGEFDLKYNSYYIAGIDDNTIYLGNYTTPLSVTELNISHKLFKEYKISIDSMHLPYKRVRISIKSPHIFLGDGTIPIMFRGNINDKNASVFSYNDAYFMEFIVIDSTNIGITTKSSKNLSDVVGRLYKTIESNSITLNHDVLTQQGNYGTFDTNGMLLWNAKHQMFIYTYYYRNSYAITDKNFSYQLTSKTIDTISRAVLDIAHYAKTDIYKLGGKSIMVNRKSTTYDDFLYINSDRLGKFEDDKVLRSAGIIDVYNITNNTYEFSFYLYHQPDKDLNHIQVYKDLLVAIVDNKLWLYHLKPKYFNNGFKTKHTVQYQE